MDPIILFLLLLLSLFTKPISLIAQPYSKVVPSHDITTIVLVGAVYCDICCTNTFSRHNYFLPGVVVHIECKLELANSPRTTEEIALSVNRTTDRYGMYKLEIPNYVDIKDSCVEGELGPPPPPPPPPSPIFQSFSCQARLIGSSSTNCNVPAGLKTISTEIKLKSKQPPNLCIYSFSALSYRPPKKKKYKNLTLCGTGNHKELLMEDSFNSSKFFLPYFPPYGFPWPPLPPLPSFPPFPPFPYFPFPPPFPPFPYFPFPPLPYPAPPPSLSFPTPPPSLPFPMPPPSLPFPTTPPSFPFPTSPPSLPFPFPPLPPFTPIPPALLSPPPPPAFNLGDPRTWVPNIPLLSPPPPPEFNLRDPRTWIPYIPPSPPNIPHNQLP